jgi:hypothetical protein
MDLKQKVIDWADERNIFTHSTVDAQFKVFEEEVNELKEAYFEYRKLQESASNDKESIQRKMQVY